MKPRHPTLFDGGERNGARALWRTAAVDGPWPEKGGGKIKRGADRHYGVESSRQILSTIKGSGLWLPFDDAHLWFWVTDNYLEDGLWIINELGFRYVRTFVWVKVTGTAKALDFDTGLAVDVADLSELTLRQGIGQYGRGAHELLLFAVRGRGLDESVCTDRSDLPSVFFAPHPKNERGGRIHSRKPPAAFELIEARSRGPFQEFFARTSRPGWLQPWGNQAPIGKEVD